MPLRDSLGRRTQFGRIGPIVQMGRGVGATGSLEQLVSLLTSWKGSGLFVQILCECCQSILEQDGLLEPTMTLSHGIPLTCPGGIWSDREPSQPFGQMLRLIGCSALQSPTTKSPSVSGQAEVRNHLR